MNKKGWKVILCGALACVMLIAAGCGSDSGKSETKEGPSAQQGDLLKSIKSKGVLVVGTEPSYPPYEFVDTSSENKKIIGIDIELGQKIADKLGVKLKVEDMNFSSLLSSLAAHKVDLAISGIFPSDERKKSIDFSDNYIQTQQMMIVRAEDAGTLKTIDDFKGKAVGVEKSTMQEKLAQAECNNSQVISLEAVPALIMELKAHKVDGIILDGIVAQQYLLFHKDIVKSDLEFKASKTMAAIALSKGNEDLVKIINEVIQENRDNKNIEKWIEEYSKIAGKNAE